MKDLPVETTILEAKILLAEGREWEAHDKYSCDSLMLHVYLSEFTLRCTISEGWKLPLLWMIALLKLIFFWPKLIKAALSPTCSQWVKFFANSPLHKISVHCDHTIVIISIGCQVGSILEWTILASGKLLQRCDGRSDVSLSSRYLNHQNTFDALWHTLARSLTCNLSARPNAATTRRMISTHRTNLVALPWWTHWTS